MKRSFGAELSRIERKIEESASWPSPGTGLAFHILQLLDDGQPHWPNSVKISFPDGQLDTAPLIAAAGYSMCVKAPNSDQFARWQSALHRFTKRDPFPRDRQTFAFRPPELVAIALGLSKSNIGGSPTVAWIRSVIETLPNKNPAQDVWTSLLHHYAAALVGVSWPTILPSRLADYELPELCLLFVLLNNGKIPQLAEVDNRKVATAIVQRAVAITQDVREPEKLAALVAGISLALRGELEDFNIVGSNLAPPKIKESENLQQSSHNDASLPLVVLVHGIRTSGKWIRRIKPILEAEGGCVVEPAGFGFFDVFRFLLPGPTRKTVIETVKWKLIHAIDRHKDRPLIIVAHSFGTFCITEILKESPQVRPAKLLFCGSIVAQNFRWDSLSQMAPDRGMRVVNECGARDIWPPLAHSVTFGYGSSGTGGFQVPGVEDRCHDLGHSGYFTKEFVRSFWVPFIKDGTITHSEFEEEMPESPWWMSVLGLRPVLPWCLWLFVGFVIFSALTIAKWAQSSASDRHDKQHIEVATGLLAQPIKRPSITPPPAPENIQNVAVLQAIDYRAFEVSSYEIRTDLRLWKPFDGSVPEKKTSPVITTRRIICVKRQSVDQFRLYGATEGTSIDARCLSGQPYWIEWAESTGRPRVNLMKEYHLVIDISSVPLGGRFEVLADMTAWNGMKEDDPWQAVVAFTNIAELKFSILFPENRPYHTRKFVRYPNQQDSEVPAEGEFKQLERPEHDQIYWEISPAIARTSYEIQWTW